MHLLVLVLAALVPSLAAGGIAASIAVRDYREAADARLTDTTRALRLAMDSEVQRVAGTVAVLATSAQLTGLAEAPDDTDLLRAFHERAVALAGRLGILMAVVARDGSQLAITNAPLGAPLPPNPRLEDIRRALDEGRTVVSDVRVGAVSARPVAAVIEPVRAGDGPLRLALVARLDPLRLSQVLAEQGLPAPGFAVLVDGAGRVAARSTEAERMVGQLARWSADLPPGEVRGTLVAEGGDGGRFRFGFERLGVAPHWTVAVAEPATIQRVAWMRPLLAFAGGGLVALLGAAAIATWLARRILRPVDALAAAARVIARGQPGDGAGALAAVPPTPVAEFEAMRLDLARAEAALRDGQAKLRAALEEMDSIYDKAPVGLCVFDAAGRFLRINERLAEINGVPAGAHIGRSVREVVPGLADAGEALHRQVMQTGRPVLDIEIEGDTPARPGLRRIWIESWSPLRDATGAVVAISVVAEEVTEDRAAEAALRRSEARLRLATEGAGAGTWEIDLVTGRGQWSVDALALQGLGSPLFTSEDWIRIAAPEDRAAVQEAWRRTVEDGAPYEIEFRTITPAPDGRERWLLSRGRVERDGKGRPLRGAGVLLDITARRRAEAALRESELALRTIFEGTLVGMVQTDPRTLRFTRVNRRFCEMLGYEEAELLSGMTFLDVTHPDDQGTNEITFREAMATTGRYEVEKRYLHKDGSVVWAVLQASTLPDVTPPRTVAAVLDITERKLAEEHQLLLMREVDHRAKNALAVVQAALRLTPKGDAGTYARAVEGRVAALARAQTLLAADRWSGAELRLLLEAELGPFLADAAEDGAAPARLDGPDTILPAGAAQPVAMAIHELATNAVKYGALSRPEGKLAVRWSVAEGQEGARLLRLAWDETGGPGLAAPPARKGFGSRVLDATIRGQLRGALFLEWRPEGLRCVIEVPLRERAARQAAAVAS